MDNHCIKVRVWDKLLNQWGDPRKFLGFNSLGQLLCENNLAQNCSTSVVTQFTGLIDKNKKEIFEGDIVKDEFRNYLVDLTGWPGTTMLNSRDICTELDFPEEFEIIGNIFENPEILY